MLLSVVSIFALISCAIVVPVASADDSFELTYDGQASKLTILTPTSGAYLNSSMVTISWSYNADDLSYYDMSVDDGEYIQRNDSSSVIELLDGSHAVEVRAHTLNSEVHLASVVFVVDTVSPTVSVSPRGTNVSTDASIVAMFSSDIDQSSVRIVLDGVAHNVTWSWFGYVATYQPPYPLTAGHDHRAIVLGQDRAGNAVFERWTFRTVDGGTVVGRYLYENGTAVANMTVMLDCGLFTVTDESGRFAITDVPVGEHKISFINDWQFTNESWFSKATSVVVTVDNIADVGDIVIADREVLAISLIVVGSVVAVAVIAGIAYFTYQAFFAEEAASEAVEAAGSEVAEGAAASVPTMGAINAQLESVATRSEANMAIKNMLKTGILEGQSEFVDVPLQEGSYYVCAHVNNLRYSSVEFVCVKTLEQARQLTDWGAVVAVTSNPFFKNIAPLLTASQFQQLIVSLS